MANLSSVASEVYDILRRYDYVLDLYGEDGNTVYEPEDARRLFGSRTQKSNKVENLMVAVIDENEDSVVRLIVGPSTDVMAIEGLRETLRTTATKYNMIYDLDTREEEIQPKDFSTKAAVREGKEQMAHLVETKLYGTSRSSYARFENARAIFRHSKRVDEETPGARTRNISKIFIENADGERYLMPVNNVHAGLAMTQHVNQGGTWADPIASKIEDMGSYFGDLGASMNYLGTGEVALLESSGALRDKCKAKRKAIRESFRRMANEKTYTAEAARFRHINDTPLLEGDDLSNLRESLTVEGRKLPERVLNACSRILAEEPMEENVLDEEADTLDAVSTTTRVLGRDVNSDAWNLLKDEGRLEVRTTPDLSELPLFKNTLAQIMFKMNEIAQVTRDDTLANLFSQVYQDYVNDKFDRDPQARREATILGIKVCQAANVQITTEADLGPRGVTAILEMEEWFRKFTPYTVLLAENESPTPRETYYGDSGRGDDDLGGENDLLFSDDGDEEYDPVSSASESPTPRETYYGDGDRGDDDIREDLTQEDIILPDEEDEGDDDIEIIPGDTPGLDLAKEVMSKDFDGTVMAEQLARLVALSGRK